jgi:glycogen(starch) synthase
MLAQSPLAGDSRILREASTLAACGHQIHIIGRDIPAEFVPPPGVTVASVGRSRGYAPLRQPHRRILPIRAIRWLLLPEHRRAVERAWVEHARELARAASPPPEVVHAHDFNTLPLAAELAQRYGARLVYDAHELWSGRPRIGRPTPVRNARERRLEMKLGNQAAAVLTVGDGVAGALRDDYGWTHVHVVRNTFERRVGEAPALARPAGAVYAGRLAPYRELEVIAAASRQLEIPVTLVGPADSTWLADFDPGAATVNPPTSLEGVDRLLAEAGLALITHSDRWRNHRLALPNKLFHAVRVGVPVVATDVGELAKTVRQYGLGRLYRAGDHHDLVHAVHSAIADYSMYRASVADAMSALTWRRDEAVLLDVYAGLRT